MSLPHRDEYHWQVEPAAAQLVAGFIDRFVQNVPFANHLATRMLAETGTRLIDWVDHLWVHDDGELSAKLQECGFAAAELNESQSCYEHSGGMFPAIGMTSDPSERLFLKVESVVDFLLAHKIDTPISGAPLASIRTAKVASDDRAEVWVVERHGDATLAEQPEHPTAVGQTAVLGHGEALMLRKRDFQNASEGFVHASRLIAAAIEDLGVDRTCDLFFAAERKYWQSRNHAARIQKSRQDRLGLGWANHDHHTYRSSREHFASLIAALELMGFDCRERFYGGAEAGWGAQVLEQSATGIVIFADVDLTPEEVAGDFAHQGLEPQSELGTVGLWCKLHGEAFLQAGLHHLECQFDFDAAREQLASIGVRTMKPFTYFDHLKQAFTEGEVWPVDSHRIDQALDDGFITMEQADSFRASGTIGSHLEILERNQGYKGFNQTGISEIIRDTDPRRAR